MAALPIRVGHVYMDRLRNTRRILDIGPQYAQSPDQKNKNCLRYVVLKQGRGPHRPGDQVDCTVESFQKWAKSYLRPNIMVKEPCQKKTASKSSRSRK